MLNRIKTLYYGYIMTFAVHSRANHQYYAASQEDLLDTTLDAAASGNLSKLQATRHDWKDIAYMVCECAALHGKLHILQWCYSQGIFSLNDERTVLALSNAAQEGHLNVLQWAKRHGAKIDSLTFGAAAATGALPILDWAKNENIPFDVHLVSQSASMRNQREVQNWLQKYYPSKA